MGLRAEKGFWRNAALVAVIAAATCVAAAPARAATTHTVSPGQSFASVLQKTRPGDRVVVKPGSYPNQHIQDLSLGGVEVEAEGTVTTGTLAFKNVSGVTVRGMFVRPAASATESAIRIYNGSHDIWLDRLEVRPTYRAGVDISLMAHDVTVTNTLIDGSAATGSTARGVRILGGADRATWIEDVVLRGNEIRKAWADNVFISGAARVTIEANHIHDPQETSEHNDNIQSAGSEDLVIARNLLSGPGAIGPDQAIIVGQSPSTASLTVTRTRIVGNVIHDWRGTGIIVAGTTDTVVAGNTVVRTGRPDFRMASFATGEPNGYRNPGLTVMGNVFEKIDSTKGPIANELRNCVETGGSSSTNVSADPRLDPATFDLASSSPCRSLAAGLGEWSSTDVCGLARGSSPDAGARQSGITGAVTGPPGASFCSTSAASDPSPSTTTTTAPPPTTTTAPPSTSTTAPPSTSTTVPPSTTTTVPPPSVVPPATVPAPPGPTAPAPAGAVEGLVLDGWGGLHSVSSCVTCPAPAKPRGGPYWVGQDMARGVAVTGEGWGYVLDGWGGLHGFRTGDVAPPRPVVSAYWPGADLARGVALLPDGSGGYVVDARGGIHPFATAGHAKPPAARGGPYWPAWDIARGILLLPDGSGGYVVDAFGGLHPVALGSASPPPSLTGPYWAGWGIVRGGSLASAAGYVIDAWGGTHSVAAGSPSLAGAYWPGWDVARGLAILPG